MARHGRRGKLDHAVHAVHAIEVVGNGRVETSLFVGNVGGLGRDSESLLRRSDGLKRQAAVAVVVVLGGDERGRRRVLESVGGHRSMALVAVDRNAVLVVLDAGEVGLALDSGDLRGDGCHANGVVAAHVVEPVGHVAHGLGHHIGRRHGVHGLHHGRVGLALGEGRLLLSVERRRVDLLGLGQLLVERLRGVVLEGEGRLADSNRGGFLAHLFSLEVALEGIEEKTVVGHAVPVKDFLLLLGADAVVLVQEVEELALGLFEGGIGAGLEVSEVGEDALFELLGVLYGAAESLESEGEAADNVGAGDVEEGVPQNTRDVFAGGEQEAANVLVLLPIDGSRDEEVFD